MRNVVVGGTLLVLLMSGCGYIKGAAGGSLGSDEDPDLTPVIVPHNKILISEGDSSTPGMAVSRLYVYDVETGVKNYLMDANQGFHVGLMAIGSDENPEGFGIEIGSKAYFYWDDATHGRSVWQTDFTQAGTRLISDIGESDLNLQMHNFNGNLLFGSWTGNLVCGLCPKTTDLTLYDPISEDMEVVVSKTSTGVLEFPRTFFFDQFFNVIREGAGLLDLVYSLGTAASATQLTTLGTNAKHYKKMGAYLFGWGDRGDGLEPSLIDPVTGSLHNVLDITMGAADSQSGPIVVASTNLAYFIANGNRLYMSDGTAGNAFQQYNLSGNGITDVSEMFLINGVLVMWACDGGAVTGCEFWKTSGDFVSTEPISDFGTGPLDGTVSRIVPFGDELLIAFVTEAGGLDEPWVIDGTAAGTQKLATFVGTDETLQGGVQIKNGKLFFTSYDTVTQEFFLWRTDGTVGGTERLFSLGMEP